VKINFDHLRGVEEVWEGVCRLGQKRVVKLLTFLPASSVFVHFHDVLVDLATCMSMS